MRNIVHLPENRFTNQTNKMNTSIEAFEFTKEKIKELLDEYGLKSVVRESALKNDPDTIRKYSDEAHVPSEYWEIVEIFPKTKFHKDEIFKLFRYLNMCGITFDKGYSCDNNSVHFEIDWSFRFEKKSEDMEHLYSINWLEDASCDMDKSLN